MQPAQFDSVLQKITELNKALQSDLVASFPNRNTSRLLLMLLELFALPEL
ncbi:hypothetical protein SLEP1_g3521 [Rubroshorea leprosula]|uniref:Uncharacterized protein n=1 Tax=Rubroshorea leprosula TaxID=152421 RepID=A0AAV5HKP5_9ROSI|nr:hypothetical protein SLEP1_g3521 [Rubroshorea leprosula]